VINNNLGPRPYFAPFSHNTSVTDGQTDRQTDNANSANSQCQ